MKNTLLHPETNFIIQSIEDCSDAIVYTDTNNIIKFWNKAAEELFGLTNNNTIGKNIISLNIFKQKESEIDSIIQNAINNSIWLSEISIHNNEHIAFSASILAKRLINSKGNLLTVCLTFQKINKDNRVVNSTINSLDFKTSLNNNQSELDNLKNTYHNIFENSPIPMWINDSTTFKFLDVNALAIKEYGYTKEEFISMTLLDIRPNEETDKSLNFNRSKLIKYNNNRIGVWTHKRKDGSLLAVDITNYPIIFNGKPARLSYLNNVTDFLATEKALEKSEKKFRAIIEKGNDVVTMYDNNFKIIYRSPSCERVVGWSDKEMMGETGLLNIHPDDRKEAQEFIKALMKQHGVYQEVSVRLLHKKGHYIWIKGTIANLLEEENINAIVFNFYDITDRKNQEDKILSSEQRFRALIENGNDIVSMYDSKMKVIYRSPSAQKLLGWTDEERIGQNAIDGLHPDDYDYASERIKTVLQNPGIPYSVNLRMFHKNGSIKWLEGTIVNLLEDKNVQSIVFNYRDVTDRKLQKEKLVASEQRFKALIENGNDIVSIFDKDLKVIYRSPSAEKLLGWSDAEMIDQKATNNIYQEDIEYASEKLREIKQHPGKAIPVTFRMKHKNGNVIWLEGTVINLLQDKYVQAIVFNFRDITEKKAVAEALSVRETQFQNLVERISDAFLSLDNDFKITYANTILENLMHKNPGILLGESFFEVFNKDSDKYIYNVVTEVHRTNKPKRFDCFSNVLQKWISGTIYPSSTGITLFFRDNTDRKKLEMELQEQQHNEQIRLVSATLEAQEKERNEIGLELHDNVNQILVGTIMILSLLKKSPVKTELIEESIINIKRAIQENRNIAHILVSPDPESKSFYEQINYLGNEMLHHAGIKTIINLEESAVSVLNKDPQLALYRIVQEQFTNIVKYAEATEVIISLELVDDFMLKMKIADNGKGMDQNTITKGIGLRNIGSRVSIFNGSTTIITRPEKGFTLEVEIPI